MNIPSSEYESHLQFRVSYGPKHFYLDYIEPRVTGELDEVGMLEYIITLADESNDSLVEFLSKNKYTICHTRLIRLDKMDKYSDHNNLVEYVK